MTHGANEHNVKPTNNCHIQTSLTATQNRSMECQWACPTHRRSEKLYTKPTIGYHANIGNTPHHEKLFQNPKLHDL